MSIYNLIKFTIVTAVMTLGMTSVYASGILSPGNAAVTGFSGTLNAQDNNAVFDINGPLGAHHQFTGVWPFWISGYFQNFYHHG